MSADYWFIRPEDDEAHANKVFNEQIGSPDENAIVLRDESGNEQKVWRCRDLQQAVGLFNSRPTTGASLTIWHSADPNGPITQKTFSAEQALQRARRMALS